VTRAVCGLRLVGDTNSGVCFILVGGGGDREVAEGDSGGAGSDVGEAKRRWGCHGDSGTLC
jgi:hypothetical protein